MNHLFKIAVIKSTKPVVSHFIKQGLELNDVDGQGMTLLMHAAANNNIDICKLLLDAGADPLIVTLGGKTAASIADELGHNEALKVISQSGTVPSSELAVPETLETLNQWVPVKELPQGISENWESVSLRRINSSLSAHVPIDQAVEWGSDIRDTPKLERSNYVESHKNGTVAEDYLLKILYSGLVNGRLFASQLREPSVLGEDDPGDRYDLLEIVCGQADIIIDYTDPVVAATGEPVFYDEIEPGETKYRARELKNLFDYIVQNAHAPLDAIERDTYNFKPMGSIEEKRVASMMEEGYGDVLGVITTCPYLLCLLDNMASGSIDIHTDNEKLRHRSANGRGVFSPNHANSPSPCQKLDATEMTDEEDDLVEISSEYQVEITKLASEYSSTASRFGNRQGIDETQEKLTVAIAHRLYQAGIPLTHMAQLHHMLVDMLDSFTTNKQKLGQLLSMSSFVSHDELDLLCEQPHHSEDAELIICRIVKSAPEDANLIRHYRNQMSRELERTGTSPSQFRSLIQKYNAGMKKIFRARDIFVKRNLRLVRHEARKYKKNQMSEADIFQEGVVGLLAAVDRYQHKKGYRFSTYALHWIKQAINRAICNQSRMIRVPVHLSQHIHKFNKLRENFFYYEKGGRDLLFLSKRMELPPVTVKRLLAVPEVVFWLDDPENNHKLENWTTCSSEDSDENDMIVLDLAEVVREVLETLPRKQAMILRMRFGIDHPESETLEQIGSRLDVTRERIRQIETKALERLRHPSRSKKLRVFLKP